MRASGTRWAFTHRPQTATERSHPHAFLPDLARCSRCPDRRRRRVDDLRVRSGRDRRSPRGRSPRGRSGPRSGSIRDRGEGGESAEEDEGSGVTLSAGLSSIYYWRGRNLFAEKEINDQNALFSIGASYAIGDFSISYWGGFQILGDNIGDNLDAGLGAEQDILFGWESEIAESLTLATTLALYFYPLAKEEAAGTAFPFYIEPQAVLTYSTAVDLKLGLFYYYGIQSAIESERYLYVNPGVEKSIELGETLGLDLAGAFGLKIPTGDAAKDAYDATNTQDVLVSAALPWSFGEGMSLAPKLSFAWTNIDGADFADSYMTFGGVDFEWEL
jgi:hypothetical protein